MSIIVHTVQGRGAPMTHHRNTTSLPTRDPRALDPSSGQSDDCNMTTTQSTDPRVVGGIYRSGYWQRTYAVTAITTGPDGFTWFTCAWDDGTTTTHCTAWDARRDSIVKEG